MIPASKKIYSSLPSTVKSILIISKGWLVGSAPDSLLGGKIPKDYDIIVPPDKWTETVVAIKDSNKFEINSFGGLKFYINDYIVDIWPEELDHFIKSGTKISTLYNLHKNVVYFLTT